MNILFLTDVHGSTDYYRDLREQAGEPDLLILGGDMTNFGGVKQAQAAVDPLREAYGRVLAVPGNVDQPEVIEWLRGEGLTLHGHGVRIGEVGFFGCGGSNITPLNTPTEFDEGTIGEVIRAGHEMVRDAEVRVLVSHTPPYDTRLDQMFSGKHVGSTAVRAFLEQEKPELCLCGHIHEAGGRDWVEVTQVCNPGGFNSRRYARVEITPQGIHCTVLEIQAGYTKRITSGVKGIATKIAGYTKHKLTK